MASYEPAAPAPDAELIYLPPQHNELYPTFADFVQRLGYLRFARDLDVVNSNNPSGFLIYESVTVNAWIYKLCIAYKQWDGKWFQTGFTITNNNHKKRILKDAILQVRQTFPANQKCLLTTSSFKEAKPWMLNGTGPSNAMC